MEWYRRYTDRSRHPQLFKAGFLGSLAFDALCDVAAEFDLGGVIPAQYCDPAWLAARSLIEPAEFGADPLDPDVTASRYMSLGLTAAEAAGLISRDGQGSWLIDGWERRQPKVPLKSSERVKKHRARAAETQRNAVKRVETDIEREKESEREKEKEREKGPVSSSDAALRLKDETLRALADRRAKDRPPGEFRDRVDAAYKAQRGGEFDWTSAEELAVGALLGKKGGEEEIHRRWLIALRRSVYPRCDSLTDLLKHWPSYSSDPATGPPSKPKDITRGTVTAESQKHLHGDPGEHLF